MKKSIFGLVVILWVVSLIFIGCGKEGPTGPPGTVTPGTLQGVVEVWEDYQYSSHNSTVDPSGVTVSLEGTPYSGVTGTDGSYRIENIPGGVYTVLVHKDSASVDGYGTMKYFNFFIGGGTSYLSPAIGRKAKPPLYVKAELDTVDIGGSVEPGILLTWEPAVTNLISKEYTIWVSDTPNFDRNSGARNIAPVSGTSTSFFLYNIPSGKYYFALRTDNGFGYFDERTGEVVYPTMSGFSNVTDRVVISSSSKIVWKMFDWRIPEKKRIVKSR